MKKILFIAPSPSVHIDRWYSYFNNLDEINTKLIICKQYMGDSLLSKIFYVFTIRRKIFKIIIKYNPDIINLHTLKFPNYLFPKYINCKIVITPWNGDIMHYSYGKELLFIRHFKRLAKIIKEKQLKEAINTASLITYNSDGMKKRIRVLNDNNIPSKFIQVPGVKTNTWHMKKHKSALKNELGLPEDKFLVLSMRNLGEKYNIDIIIEAAHELSKIDKNIMFVFIFVDDIHKIMFLKDITKYKLDKKVKIVGQVSHNEILKYCQVCDVGVSISSKDSCPQSVLEGMSTQLPMIVGDIPQLRDLVKDNYNGLVTPCKDIDSLVNTILKLKSDINLAKKIGENARVTVMKKHDYYQNMNRMKKLFLELL